MVSRRHHHTAHLRTAAKVPLASGFSELGVLVVECAELPDRSHAVAQHVAHLAGRQPQEGVSSLLGQHLRAGPGSPDYLAALADVQLHVVDLRTGWDRPERQCVADPDLSLLTGFDRVADLQPVGGQDVPPVAVHVLDERDSGRAVRIVLDGLNLAGHAGLVALEVDDPVAALVSAAAVSDRNAALVVPACPLLQRLEQRLPGLRRCDVFCGLTHLASLAWGHRLLDSQRHLFFPCPIPFSC